MLRKFRGGPVLIDLGTVRETIALIVDDMDRAPELSGVRTALASALAEIDRIGLNCKNNCRRAPAAANGLRFVPWKPGA